MTGKLSGKTLFRVADLSQNQATKFQIEPDSETLTRIADDLNLLGLKKLRFSGQIKASGKRDWKVTGQLGATVVQPCVVTLEPVTSRVESQVSLLFKHDYEEPNDEEFELTDEENTEALGEEINVEDVMQEALALALPLYPRSEDANLENSAYTEPGKKAMTDEDARPFAGLASLRDKLVGGDDK